jgi:hypothetical protein
MTTSAHRISLCFGLGGLLLSMGACSLARWADPRLPEQVRQARMAAQDHRYGGAEEVYRAIKGAYGAPTLERNGTYRSEPTKYQPSLDLVGADNFFVQSPSGTQELSYLNGYSPQTLLENTSGHRRLVRVDFHGHNGAHKTFFIARHALSHELSFESDGAMNFSLSIRWWNNRWH